MTIPARLNSQRDFSAGELDPLFLRRDDTEIQRAGARVMSDWMMRESGGFSRRPGSTIDHYDKGPVGIVTPASERVFDFVIRENGIAFYEGGALHTAITAGIPWGPSTFTDVRWTSADHRLILVNRAFRPQVITFDAGADTWTRSDFAFRETVGGETRQLFYRFVEESQDVTMQVSARTGSNINITFSGNVLDPNHAGTVFLYAGRQIRIDSVLSSSTASGTALEELPRSMELHLRGLPVATGFNVGELVELAASGVRGQVTGYAQGGQRLRMVAIKNWDIDIKLGAFDNTDVVGETNAAQYSSDDSNDNLTPQATTIWEEAFMSEVRGWPGGVTWSHQRLMFYDFDQLPEAQAYSRIGQYNDFKGGEDPDDAFLEITPQTGRVLHMVGATDLFVLSDRMVYFIPISETNPLAPGSVSFKPITAGGAARATPVSIENSVLFVSRARQRVMAIIGIGQDTRPYEVVDLTRFHPHLIKTPVALASSPGDDEIAGEHIFVVNEDGSMAVGRRLEGQDFIGWLPWRANNEGDVRWAYGDDNRILLWVEYEGVTDTIEHFDADRLLDGATVFPDANIALPHFANQTLQAYVDGFYLGDVALDANGEPVEAISVAQEAVLGFTFTPRFEPFITNFESGQDFRQRTRRRKVKRGAVTTLDSRGGWRVGSREVALWRAGENQEEPPPERSETITFRVLGRSYDPDVPLIQDIPGPLTVAEIGMEVTS